MNAKLIVNRYPLIVGVGQGECRLSMFFSNVNRFFGMGILRELNHFPAQ